MFFLLINKLIFSLCLFLSCKPRVHSICKNLNLLCLLVYKLFRNSPFKNCSTAHILFLTSLFQYNLLPHIHLKINAYTPPCKCMNLRTTKKKHFFTFKAMQHNIIFFLYTYKPVTLFFLLHIKTFLL